MSRSSVRRQLQFLGSENPGPDPATALFHVIPVPFERSVSYGVGAARGPGAILEASEQLEVFDGIDVPLRHGIYTWPAVECDGDTRTVFDRVQSACARALAAAAVPVVLGGEHALTLPAVEAAASAGELGVVQLDAHGDLRDHYHGERYSHASVMRRCYDLGVPIHSLGVRALAPDDREMRHAHPDRLSFQDAADLVPFSVGEVLLPAAFPDRVYLTIDLDGLDPSLVSATGTPEPGGLGWYQTLALVDSLARRRRIVSFDVVELAPVEGRHADDFCAARLVYQVMGIIARRRKAIPALRPS